jgi:hypothetical protein
VQTITMTPCVPGTPDCKCKTAGPVDDYGTIGVQSC